MLLTSASASASASALVILKMRNKKTTGKKMGMYSYIRLAILSIKAGQVISTQEKNKIIQILYKDREADPNSFAEMAFDLNGNINDSVPWYDVQENIKIFSKKYSEYIFIVRERSAEEEFAEEGPYYSSFNAGNLMRLKDEYIHSAFN